MFERQMNILAEFLARSRLLQFVAIFEALYNSLGKRTQRFVVGSDLVAWNVVASKALSLEESLEVERGA